MKEVNATKLMLLLSLSACWFSSEWLALCHASHPELNLHTRLRLPESKLFLNKILEPTCPPDDNLTTGPADPMLEHLSLELHGDLVRFFVDQTAFPASIRVLDLHMTPKNSPPEALISMLDTCTPNLEETFFS